MKRLFTIILSIVSVFAITSCDDFLDRKPTNMVDTESSISTYSDAVVAMNGLMRQLLSSSFYGRNMLLYADAKGGDMAVVTNGRGYDALYTFSHSPISSSYSGFWTSAYSGIAQINGTLEAIEKIEDSSSEDFTTIKGMLYTFRAMYYFDLCRLYGKDYGIDPSALAVPITLKLDASALPLRASVSEVYAQIDSDLKEGANLLKGKSVSKGFINYYGNLAIQARVALHKKDYSTALSLAKEIIEDGGYSLYSNANWVSSWSKQFGSESIIEWAVEDDEADLGGSALGIMFVRQADPVYPRTLGYFVASDSWLELMNEDPTDVRWGVMDEDELSQTSGHPDVRNGACYKYVGGLDRAGDGKVAATAVNIKICRLSEIYLIAAEAAFKTNDKSAAANYLKEISKRAPALAEPTASTITLEMIMNEKAKELYGEGFRYFDRIRNDQTIEYNDIIVGAPGELPHPGRPSVIDLKTFYKVILPISENEQIRYGKDNSGNYILLQNPGY